MPKVSRAAISFFAALVLTGAVGCGGGTTNAFPSAAQLTLAASPPQLSFSTSTAPASQQQSVTIQNHGNLNIVIDQVEVTGSPAFKLMRSSLPASLAPGHSGQVVVGFTPAANGSFSASLVIVPSSQAAITVPLVGDSGKGNVTVSISPANAVLQVGSRQQFTASVTGSSNKQIAWYVNGMPGGNSTDGTISSSGLYQTPASVPAGGMVTITAKSVAANSSSASAAVTLQAAAGQVSVSVSPTSATVVGGQSRQFMATVSGTSNTAVTWAVNGVQGGDATYGTISAAGLYTAPPCPANSSVTVRVNSFYDTSASASATVSLTPAGLTSTDRYVATNGSDSNDGSACHPWATIQHAADMATAGMTVHVGAGTYYISSFIWSRNSGTSSARIRFEGSDYNLTARTWGTKIVSSDIRVWYNGGAYLDIVGFEMSSTNNGAVNGVNMQAGYGRVLHNHIYHIKSNFPGAAVYTGGGANYTVVDGNMINDIATTWGGNTDNQAIYISTSYCTITNNLIYNFAKIGIQIWDGKSGTGNPHNDVVSGNTVFGGYRAFTLGAYNGNVADYNTITDNVFYKNQEYGFVAFNSVGSHNVIDHNNVYGNGGGNWDTTLAHTNDITADPLFVNYQSNGSGDYRLQSSSPDRKGTATGAPPADFLGLPRPQGAEYDVGAFQYPN